MRWAGLQGKRLHPESGFHGSGGAGPAVVDFWGWAFSDLRGNTTRGVLAEFLVGSALGLELGVREPWANWDLTVPGGLRIEVKASGYLQSWQQAKPSKVIFRGLKGRTWDAETGIFGDATEFRADVFVFCVQECEETDAYDPLDLSQWGFYVLAGQVVREEGRRSLSLASVRRLGAHRVAYGELAAEIERVRKQQQAPLPNHPESP